jgi:hypothetical protein
MDSLVYWFVYSCCSCRIFKGEGKQKRIIIQGLL